MTAATSQAAWDALRRERDELAAQVEVMREALRAIARDNRPYTMAQNAIEVLTLPNTAADILRQRDALVLREAADIANQWGDARTDDHGGHALRNYAARIRNMAANLETQHG